MHKWCDIVTDGSIEGPSGEDLPSYEWNDQSLWGLELRILSTEGDLSNNVTPLMHLMFSKFISTIT